MAFQLATITLLYEHFCNFVFLLLTCCLQMPYDCQHVRLLCMFRNALQPDTSSEDLDNLRQQMAGLKTSLDEVRQHL